MHTREQQSGFKYRECRILNILFLSELFYPHGGGAELATQLYAKLLSESGINVKVVTNRFAGESENSGTANLTIYRRPIFTGGNSNKFSILPRLDLFLSSLMRELIKWADLLYIPRFWYSGILVGKARGKSVITHLHDYISMCPLSNLFDAHHRVTCFGKNHFCPPRCIYTYEKSKYRVGFSRPLTSSVLNMILGRNLGQVVTLSDAIICVSEAQRRLVARASQQMDSKLHTIYNPLPEVPYTQANGDDFGYFGGPTYVKGFQVLCKALDCVKDQRIRVHATNFTNSEFAATNTWHEKLTTYKRLDSTAFQRIWEKLRAVVVPSIWHEPLPYVVSESVLRGKIVVASKAGGISEQLQGSEGNVLCEMGNYRQLADALDHVRGMEKEETTELGNKNREKFLRKFDNKAIIKRFIEICERHTSS